MLKFPFAISTAALIKKSSSSKIVFLRIDELFEETIRVGSGHNIYQARLIFKTFVIEDHSNFITSSICLSNSFIFLKFFVAFLSADVFDHSINYVTHRVYASFSDMLLAFLQIRVSPALCTDLAGLPRALTVLATHDMLHDEGVVYANRFGEWRVF